MTGVGSRESPRADPHTGARALTSDWEREADRLAREDELQRAVCEGDVPAFILRYNLGTTGRRKGQGKGQNDRLTYIQCPLHAEKTASFVFYAAHTTRTGEVMCHCFGCQWTGDLVALAAELRGLTRSEFMEDPVRWR